MSAILSFLDDQETAIDLLNNDAIARSIVKLTVEEADRPLTIGVHGDWGAGKSSILEMVSAGLKGNDEVLCLRFNGWQFQGFEDAKIALLEGIVTGLVAERGLAAKAQDKVVEALRAIDWLKVARVSGGLAFTAFTGVPSVDVVKTGIKSLKGLVSKGPPDAAQITAAVGGLEDLLRNAPSPKRLPDEVRAFHRSFDELLKEAGVRRLVVLVDDLDRCLPETTIETLEAMRLFVLTPKTAFVIGADEGMIEYSVRKHFPDLPDGAVSYGRNYLEKLIQVPFRIPQLGTSETRIYVTLLLVGAEIGRSDPEAFDRLLVEARKCLSRPWEGSRLSPDIVRKALGTSFSDNVKDALVVSDEISVALADGTVGNPRQIKRFLNLMHLRHDIAVERGLGDEVQIPILAKVMVAERFFPDVFEAVQRSALKAHDGVCPDLAELETSDTRQPAAAKGRSDETPWTEQEGAAVWAALEPKLAAVDLRPYLFVTRDRRRASTRDFGPERLSRLAQNLRGGRLAVAGLTADIKALSEPDAATVFDILRAGAATSGNLSTAPSGALGLAALTKHHPSLQGNAIGYLESLEPKDLGPWVTVEWPTIFTESEPKRRFGELKATWASSGSPALKAVLQPRARPSQERN